MRLLIVALTLLLFFTSPSKANQTAKYQYCNHHKFTYYLLKVYDISLCNNKNQSLSYDNLYNQDFALIIKYSINIKGEKFAESSMEEIARYYKLSEVDEKNYHNQLLNIFVDVKPKDEIAAVYKASGTISFYHNQKEIGQINDKKFSKIFLDIWLHPDAHYANMRKDLLQR